MDDPLSKIKVPELIPVDAQHLYDVAMRIHFKQNQEILDHLVGMFIKAAKKTTKATIAELMEWVHDQTIEKPIGFPED